MICGFQDGRAEGTEAKGRERWPTLSALEQYKYQQVGASKQSGRTSVGFLWCSEHAAFGSFESRRGRGSDMLAVLSFAKFSLQNAALAFNLGLLA